MLPVSANSGGIGVGDICRVTWTTYSNNSSEWYMSEREHLRRIVSTVVRAGMEIRFSRADYDPQSGTFYGVYARSVDPVDRIRSETLLGTCGTSERDELRALIERERPMRKPEIRLPAQQSTWLSLVDKEISELQADWSLMTEDARVAKLAAIRDRLRAG